MNERIKELMKQAMVKTADMSRPGRKELDPKKFAELIVQECADVAAGERSGWEARTAIEQHFGVE